ncbi:MAG: hypothetical protein JSV05_03310 [Candidatus Bathyarchaeota archaeon]|nr:MAG: hypothetical protein JSV05_03310 [Candidatus Bathyarchaeota archaeon]
MSRKKIAIMLAVIVMVTIPIAFFGILYYQLSNLEMDIDFDIVQAVDWLFALLNKQLPDITVALVITNPTFLHLDITDVYVQLYIEDQYVYDTTLENLFVPAGKTMSKGLTFSLAEGVQAYNVVNHAMSTYGGEVKVGIGGHAVAHQLLLSLRIPFYVEKYIMTSEGSVKFQSAAWVNAHEQQVSSTFPGTEVYVQLSLRNPTRQHTVSNTLVVEIRKHIPLWTDETMKEEEKNVTLSSLSTTTLSFSFTPPSIGRYHFDVFLDGTKIYTQPNTVPPRLEVLL